MSSQPANYNVFYNIIMMEIILIITSAEHNIAKLQEDKNMY